jgi:hypothetical protein
MEESGPKIQIDMPRQNYLLYDMNVGILDSAQFPLHQLTIATESTARAVVHSRRNTSEIPPASFLFPPHVVALMMVSGDAMPLLASLSESFVAAP